MTFVEVPGDAGHTVVHLEGWTVLRVRRDLDAAAAGLLVEAVAGEDATRIAVDLERHTIGDGLLALLDAVLARRSLGATVVVVASADDQREALREAGAGEVFESLDEALHVEAPAIVVQQDHVAAALPPSQGDVTVVTANDLLGPGPR